MKLLLIVGILLTILFGFSVSAYLVQYKLKIDNYLLKTLGFLTIGTFVTVTTFAIAVMAVWPPYF